MAIVTRSGLSPDGTCVHVTIGRIEIPCISVSYGGGKQTAEWVYRMGQQEPEDDTPGTYEPGEGSIKMSSKNFRLFVLPNLARIGAANVRRIAVVSFHHPDVGDDADRLIGARIFEPKAGAEAGGKALEVECPLRYKAVAWGRQGVRFGNPTGTGAVGSIRL